MSDYICNTHQWRLNNDDSPCPYCEISRLKAELEQAHQLLIKDVIALQKVVITEERVTQLQEENAQLHKAADSLWDGITEVLTQQNIDRVEQLYKIELALLLGGTVSNNDTPAWEEELHQRINDYIKDNARLTCEAALMEAEIARLKAEMEEATKQKSDWHSMYQEAYDQLAEARAEIDKTYKSWCGRDYMHMPLSAAVGCAVAEACQEVAKEVVEIMGGWPLKNSTLVDLRGRIIRHFRLEE